MMASDLIDDARSAMADSDWAMAYDLLRDACAKGPLDADGYADLATSAWWSGRPDECIDARERAFAGYMKAGDSARASMIALDLAESQFHKKADAIGMGWVKQAERLLADLPPAVEHGYLARMQAVIAFEGKDDLDEAIRLAERAYEIGAEFGDHNLMALSLHDRGRITVATGDVVEGMALMDEAMVAAVGGELGALYTGKIYCNMIDICEQLADWRRAGDWSDAAKRWCERAGNSSGFPGVCRIHRAEIMRLRGDWTTAEAEAIRACDELGNFVDFSGEAFYEIGEIRLHMGDFEQAEQAFKRAHGLGRDPEPGMAQLHLARGSPDSAWRLISQSLKATTAPLKRARLLPTYVEAAIAGGDLDSARNGVDELDRIATEYQTPALIAHAADGRGALQLADGDHEAAAQHLRKAVDLWRQTDIPYLAAKSRVALAAAYERQGSLTAAELELDSARQTFHELGAMRDAKATLQKLRSAPAAPAHGQRVRAALMFTDIVDSTPLIQVIGDAAWDRLLAWHHRTLRTLFDKHNGREIENAGDGFFVAFEDADSALACAGDIQSTLANQRDEHGFAPGVRVGLHLGKVTETEHTLTGEEVHKASRISALGAPGEIVASIAFADATNADVADGPRTVKVKGFTDAIDVVTLRWQ